MGKYEYVDIFNQIPPTYKIKKPIRLIELFGGIGAQAMALRNIGANFEHYKLVEFDKYPCASYNAIHGTNFEPTDIRDVTWKDLNIVDTDKYDYIMTYSFPCFTGDTLILTSNGFKKIKDVSVGESVMTHTGEFHTVLKSECTGYKNIYSINSMGNDFITCTENHKFLVRNRTKVWDGYTRRYHREFTEPEWVECRNLNKDTYLGVPINKESKLPVWDGVTIKWAKKNREETKNTISNLLKNGSFWYLIGRYVGDGWDKSGNGIIICCEFGEESEITKHIENCGFNYCISKEKTVNKIHISLKELSAFVNQFGKYAYGKFIPGFMFDMPIDLLEYFLNGYLDADGYYCKRQNLWKASSVSRELIYGISTLIQKVYKRPVSIYKTKRKETCIIDGRVCNQRTSYSIHFKKVSDKQDKAFYENGYIWYPINSVKSLGASDYVYDIEVETDHSFIANNAIAHNCTDISNAGLQLGLGRNSGTRSGLLWEVERLLKELKENSSLPQVLLMENVVAIHQDKFAADFDEWQEFLRKLGYSNYMQDLNAKDFGVAQNRDRTFMVSILGNWNYEFPETVPLTKCIKDYLEDDVDEKYYVKSERAMELIDRLVKDGKLDNY